MAARAELDERQAQGDVLRRQEMISDDGGMICFAISDYLDGYSKKVMGTAPHARYD